MNNIAEIVSEWKFTVAEVSALLAFEMAEWMIDDARACFAEMGGHPAAFDRLVTRLEVVGIIKSHPRLRGRMQLDQLCEGLKLRYARVDA